MTQKHFFTELQTTTDFVADEIKTLENWNKSDLVSKYLHKNDASKKIFSFIDGPITANNPMGVHHARGRTLKDVIQRYKNAQGFAQRFQNGFDCQGLWVEVEVEKEQGFNSKKDIQNFGLANFTNACLARVDKYAAIQTEQSKRLGMFMDWENSYYTNSLNNNLYIWHFLKIVSQKGWLCQKETATTWCPRCETGLSQHEQADGYKDVTDTSVYLKFKLKNKENEYVLAWTTTPWTLSANVLLAINPAHTYVKANYQSQTLYLAKISADRLGLTDYQEVNAATLLGLEYDTLYDIPAQNGVKHTIVEWDQVDPVQGSGVVHIAPGCGQEDYDLGKKLGSSMIAPLNEQGHFKDGYGELSGLYAHSVSQKVFDYLQNSGSLFKTEPITHRYPHCWRCKTKCLFRLEKNWFIKTDEIRPLLKEAATKVKWHPKYTQRRMQNWLDNMEDWMISRKRFYGLALPFFQCVCGQLTVVGSLEELKSLATNPELIEGLKSLHRPWVDEITIHCPHCQKVVERITDVGDCWLDAGVVPFSTLKYLEDKSYWQKWFPAEFISEMIEQIRLWYYSMLFFSVTLEGVTPYLNVLSYTEVRDETGERMSKTKKNGIAYDEAVTKMGADAMRWLYCRQKSHSVVNFGFTIADQVKREFMLLYWNTFRFFTTLANSQNWQPSDNVVNPSHVLDKWITDRLIQTTLKVTKLLDKYDTTTSTKLLEEFLNDLSTWYIRRSRDRFESLPVLYVCLLTFTKLVSPFIPFFAEYIYQQLNGHREFDSKDSVHLQPWPNFIDQKPDITLIKKMDQVRNYSQLIHGQRQLANIKIRQPLSGAKINSPEMLSAEFIEIIKEETNIKLITIIQKTGNIEITLDTVITDELREEGEYRDFVRSIQVMRKESGLALDQKIKILAPSWPTNFKQAILDKTLAISIEKSDKLSIVNAS